MIYRLMAQYTGDMHTWLEVGIRVSHVEYAEAFNEMKRSLQLTRAGLSQACG